MQNLEWDLYKQMYTIRKTEETLLSLFSEGVLYGTVHTCIGQEACAVGVINALDRSKDVIWSTHRGHGHFIAYCDEVEALIAEIMGKATGVCGGFGGSQHLHKRNFYTNGILGGTVPCAVGSALAEKEKKSDAIVCVFLGDGALGEGVVYESFNIASLWKLPIVFILEHNKYAQSTPSHLEHAGNLNKRAQPFDIPTTEINSKDITEIYNSACEVITLVREHKQPHFLIIHTYRLSPHSKGDDFRPDDEIEYYRKQDILHLHRQKLLHLDREQLMQLEGEIDKRVETGVIKARTAPHHLPK